MTAGLFLISMGVPSAISLPKFQHDDALRHLHDEAHVVLDSARSRRRAPESAG